MVVGTAELRMDPAGLLAWEAAAVLGKLVTSRGLKNHKNLLCLEERLKRLSFRLSLPTNYGVDFCRGSVLFWKMEVHRGAGSGSWLVKSNQEVRCHVRGSHCMGRLPALALSEVCRSFFKSNVLSEV